MATSVFPAQGASTALRFSETFSATDLKLVELPADVLGELKDGLVTIRGSEDDEAVLCTSGRTFQLRLVESSNTTLLFRPRTEAASVGEDETEITSAVSGHLEVVEIAPRTEKLLRLLQERPYSGPEREDPAVRRLDEEGLDDSADAEADGAEEGGQRRVRRKAEEAAPRRRGLYTFADLRGRVQASDEQLRAALKQIDAFEVDGHWRVLDATALREAVDLLLLTATERDWRLDRVSVREAREALAGEVDPLVLEQAVRSHGAPLASGPDDFALDLPKLSLLRARTLLALGHRMRLEDFMESWRGCLPEGGRADLALLKGVAITETVGSETFIVHFPSAALSPDPPQRFAELFRQRAKWSLADLEPYAREVLQPGQTMEQLLLKHTRASRDMSRPGGPLIYSARD